MIGIGINPTTTDFPDDICHKAGAISVALDRERTIVYISISHEKEQALAFVVIE